VRFEVGERYILLLLKWNLPPIAEHELNAACFVFALNTRIAPLIPTTPYVVRPQGRSGQKLVNVKFVAVRENREVVHLVIQ